MLFWIDIPTSLSQRLLTLENNWRILKNSRDVHGDTTVYIPLDAYTVHIQELGFEFLLYF